MVHKGNYILFFLKSLFRLCMLFSILNKWIYSFIDRLFYFRYIYIYTHLILNYCSAEIIFNYNSLVNFGNNTNEPFHNLYSNAIQKKQQKRKKKKNVDLRCNRSPIPPKVSRCSSKSITCKKLFNPISYHLSKTYTTSNNVTDDDDDRRRYCSVRAWPYIKTTTSIL